jgi:hypothetical protein
MGTQNQMLCLNPYLIWVTIIAQFPVIVMVLIDSAQSGK